MYPIIALTVIMRSNRKQPATTAHGIHRRNVRTSTNVCQLANAALLCLKRTISVLISTERFSVSVATVRTTRRGSHVRVSHFTMIF